jgi:hypothetical protein
MGFSLSVETLLYTVYTIGIKTVGKQGEAMDI